MEIIDKNVATTNGFCHNNFYALATTATYYPRSTPV
jgi:hypothetical protein